MLTRSGCSSLYLLCVWTWWAEQRGCLCRLLPSGCGLFSCRSRRGRHRGVLRWGGQEQTNKLRVRILVSSPCRDLTRQNLIDQLINHVALCTSLTEQTSAGLPHPVLCRALQQQDAPPPPFTVKRPLLAGTPLC